MATPEGAILHAILDYLAATRVFALRMNTLAMPTADGKRFIKAGVPGMADILAFPHCKAVLWIEVKSATGRQSELQKSFQQQVEREGHRYIVARSVDDILEALGSA